MVDGFKEKFMAIKSDKILVYPMSKSLKLTF